MFRKLCCWLSLFHTVWPHKNVPLFAEELSTQPLFLGHLLQTLEPRMSLKNLSSVFVLIIFAPLVLGVLENCSTFWFVDVTKKFQIWHPNFSARPFGALVLAAGETKFPLLFCHRISFFFVLEVSQFFFASKSTFYPPRVNLSEGKIASLEFQRQFVNLALATLVLMNKPWRLPNTHPIPYLTFFI